jgi:hypothetical protein
MTQRDRSTPFRALKVGSLGSGRQVSINSVPKRDCRSSAPQRVPISIPAQGFTQTCSCQPDRGEGPRCCRLHEELAAIDKISRNGTP